MAPAKPVRNTSQEQETSSFPEQYAYQPIGDEDQDPVELGGVNPYATVKVKNPLSVGDESSIPEAPQKEVKNVPDINKNKAKQAGGEVARRKIQQRPKREGRKGMVAYVSESQAADLAAIAAAKDLGVTDYLARVIEEHVSANPQLVKKGKAKLGRGEHAPVRTHRLELEEEVVRLRVQLGSVNPA